MTRIFKLYHVELGSISSIILCDESFSLLNVNTFARNCQSEIQASSCIGWLMSCLETATVPFFPVTFLNLNFLTTSVLSLIRKSHLFALNLTHNLLLILTYHILLLARSFVALSQYRRSLFGNLFAISHPTVMTWSHSDHFAEKEFRWLSALDLQICEWLTAVWVCSSAVQGSGRDHSS